MGNIRHCKSCGCIRRIYAGDVCKTCYYQVYMRYYRKAKVKEELNHEYKNEYKNEYHTTDEQSSIQIPQDYYTLYESKKQEILAEYQRFNRIKASDIAELAYLLELINYPIDRIVDKLIRDLSQDIAKAVILKAIPSKYLTAARMKSKSKSKQENIDDIDSYTLSTLYKASDTCKELNRLLEHMISNLQKMPKALERLDNDEEVLEICKDIDVACQEIIEVIDTIRENRFQDMRTFIRDLQRLCILLLALTYSYRYIARIFGVSVKWISKIVRGSSIENMPSIYITLDRDVKKGEQLDILPYALGLYKISKSTQEHEQE